MRYVQRTNRFDKFRLMVSGLSNSGKTTSLPTFIYGPYDYHNESERADALTYAEGKSLVIIECPGETGHRSLPVDTENITSHYIETDDADDPTTMEWSSHAIDLFLSISDEVRRNKPDYLFWDGLHWLYNHLLNKNSNGEFLAGVDMDLGPSGQSVQ